MVSGGNCTTLPGSWDGLSGSREVGPARQCGKLASVHLERWQSVRTRFARLESTFREPSEVLPERFLREFVYFQRGARRLSGELRIQNTSFPGVVVAEGAPGEPIPVLRLVMGTLRAGVLHPYQKESFFCFCFCFLLFSRLLHLFLCGFAFMLHSLVLAY